MMLKFARYFKQFKIQFIIGPFFKLLEAVFELIVPLVMARIIDVGIKNGDTAYIIKMGGLIILLGFLGLCFALICQYSAAVASQGVGTMIRNDLFSHIHSLSHSEIDRIGTSSLITRMTNDINQVQLAVAMMIRLLIRAPFLVIGASVMAMMIDLNLSVIFLVMAVLVTIALYFIMSRSVPFYKIIQKKLDNIAFVTRENLTGARVVRAFSKQKKEEDRFEEAGEEWASTAISVGRLTALLNPVMLVILNLAIVGILWLGGKQVYHGQLTQGELIALVNYMTQISLALVVVANLVVIFTKAGASAARIHEVFNLQTSIADIPSEKMETQYKDKIVFQNVSFSYPESDENALEQITCTIRAGETIGVIGGTGSGKSTLIQLMPRFYDVTGGNIYVDGRPVQDFALKELRVKFGIVPQNPVLFSGSIEDNLKWGNENLTEEEMRMALVTAQADEIKKDWIEQGGRNLSGGQRQRLTLARALARNPEILILDDSFSALDYLTEAKVRKGIQHFAAQRKEPMTILIVTQRCHSIKNADRILVLDDGRLVGNGKHEELFENCDIYREICISQLKEEEVHSYGRA